MDNESTTSARGDERQEARLQAGARVEGLRTRFSLTQGQLGDATKLGRATIHRLEKGAPNIGWQTWVKVAAVLLVPPEELDPSRHTTWRLKSIDDLWDHARVRQRATAEQERSSAIGRKPPPTQGTEMAETPESRASTGAAVEAVADELVAGITGGSIRDIAALDSISRDLARRFRGPMIPFCHFFRIGPGYVFSSWRDANETADYITSFRHYTQQANAIIGEKLRDQLLTLQSRGCLSICVSEYSRAIFSGMDKLPIPRPSFDIVFVERGERALVPGELTAARQRLKALGFTRVRDYTLNQWTRFLKQVRDGSEKLDLVFFGAEAVTADGGVVFPQIVADDELTFLREIVTKGSENTKVVCVAEAYKFLEVHAEQAVEEIKNGANAKYTVLPSDCWSYFVTDFGLVERTADSFDTKSVRHKVTRKCREFLEASIHSGVGGRILPFSYMDDDHFTRLELLVADIDDTITAEDGTIPSLVVSDLEHLCEAGVRILLVTGRSAGAALTLATYLPGVLAVVGENGLLMATRAGGVEILAGEQQRKLANSDLKKASDYVQRNFSLTPTDDSEFRKLERTFERPADFGPRRLKELNAAVSEGLEVIASSIHIHVRPHGWDKADGVRAALGRLDPKPSGTIRNVIVVGASANDIPLFDAYPETSIAVANVRRFVSELKGHSPRFVTQGGHASGFHEIVERILEAKQGQ